ncbi:MAG TPA: DNA-binding domain-containing protein, partial [Patescibacteria group bacterium]|nr:DNA-binding domain-containing protein [Patescibacteria group bacterium]
MRLSEVQDLFARTMLAPPEAVEAPEASIAALFTAAPDVLPERLQIYRNTIVGTLTDLLLATYPMVKALTGEDFATVMLRSYVLSYPPHEACLARYGGGVSDFIGSFAPAADIKYLPDVARLEWAINESYYAVDDTALSPLELLEVQPDQLSD